MPATGVGVDERPLTSDSGAFVRRVAFKQRINVGDGQAKLEPDARNARNRGARALLAEMAHGWPAEISESLSSSPFWGLWIERLEGGPPGRRPKMAETTRGRGWNMLSSGKGTPVLSSIPADELKLLMAFEPLSGRTTSDELRILSR
jgi:hypothetical protein